MRAVGRIAVPVSYEFVKLWHHQIITVRLLNRLVLLLWTDGLVNKKVVLRNGSIVTALNENIAMLRSGADC